MRTSHCLAYDFVEPVPSPEAGVEIWLARLDTISSGHVTELGASLDSTERERAAKFHFERDQQRFLATRGLLRLLLGALSEISASSLVFGYGLHGKPELVRVVQNEPALHFNVSHAAGVAIFAMAWNRKVGIDIETSDRLKRDPAELSGLARRILSPRELAIWHVLPNDIAREKELLRAWTRKEAYLKATGEGLSDRLVTIDVTLDAVDVDQSATLGNWKVHDLSAPKGFLGAIAVESIEL